MGQNFIGCDRDQVLLMPPDLRDWLPEGHLAWFVIDAVAELDLAAFFGSYRQDGLGRAAHDPAMMVALLLYAYAVGERSSRRIERRCVEDVAFRVIAANVAPDHATVARFRVRHEDALGDLFGEILGLCARAGLVSVGVLALDGTKIHADASVAATRTYRQIAEEVLADAAAVDAAEDEQFGDRRGDELPAELADPKRRRQRLREAKRELQAQWQTRAQDVGSSRPERLQEAKRRLEEEHAVEVRAQDEHEQWRARRQGELGARPPTVAAVGPQPAGRVNTTDPDSRPVKTRRGFIQGYNAQAVATAQQIVVAADVILGSSDGGQLEPMITQAQTELARADVTDPVEVVVADAAYWSQAQINRLDHKGIEALIPPDSPSNTRPPPKGKHAGPYAVMRDKLKTPRATDLYCQRQWMIEPIFAQTKFNRKADRFQRRGMPACRSEWRLITATHNLLKLWRHTTPQTA
jgi:transposase